MEVIFANEFRLISLDSIINTRVRRYPISRTM